MFVLAIFLVFLTWSESCDDYDDTSCPTADGTCVWDNPCGRNPFGGCCSEPACRHKLGSGDCTQVGEEKCFWNGEHCQRAECHLYGDSTNCQGEVNGDTCVWNPEGGDDGLGICDSAGCHDYNHRTSELCTGSTVNGDTCYWTGGTEGCQRGDCHLFDVNDCHGSVNGETCVWDPEANDETGVCEVQGCHDYKHNEEGTCKGIFNGQICRWSEGECISWNCGDAQGPVTCSSLGLRCKWSKDLTECVEPEDAGPGDAVDCSQGIDENDCKEGASFGCVWSDNKCTKSSASRIAIPALLIALLFAFIY